MSNSYTIEWLSPEEAKNEEIVAGWNQLLSQSDHPYNLMQSPVLFYYDVSRSTSSHYYCGVIRDRSLTIVGIIPTRIRTAEMSLSIKSLKIYSIPLKVLQILGGEPLVEAKQEIYNFSLKSIFDKFKNCSAVEFHGFRLEASPYAYICNSGYLTHILNATELNLIYTQSTFEAYLSKFSSKTRYNYRRMIKLLTQRGEGRLHLQRIDKSSDVGLFLEVAERISLQSTQYRETGWSIVNSEIELSALSSVADQGFLRSYILYCGNEPCAYVKGHQFNEIYYYSQIGYCPEFADYSPGTVLLYMILEDLHKERPPKYVNMYYGDTWYKRQFATVSLPFATMFLFRKTILNRVLLAGHTFARETIKQVKSSLGGH